MGIVSFLMGFLFVLAIRIIFSLISSGQIVLFDDSVSVYSVLKDFVGLLIAGFGIYIAFSWKKQVLFSQQNAKAIEISESINKLKVQFNKAGLLILRNSTLFKDAATTLPGEEILQKFFNNEYTNEEKDEIDKQLNNFLFYFRNFHSSKIKLAEFKSNLSDATNNALSLREKELSRITNEIASIISPLIIDFPKQLWEVNTDHFFENSSHAVLHLRFLRISSFINYETSFEVFSLINVLKVNDLLEEQKKILEKYY